MAPADGQREGLGTNRVTRAQLCLGRERWRRVFGHEIGTRYVMAPRCSLLLAAFSSMLDFCATRRLAVLNAISDRVPAGP